MHTSDISQWVESLSTNAPNSDDACNARKRPRALSGPVAAWLPSPPAENIYEEENIMPSSPKRRRTTDIGDNVDTTPRPPLRVSALDGATPLISDPSRSGSSISRSSSPSKQLRNAEVQPTGFNIIGFENYDGSSQSLKLLLRDLRRIHTGYGILPQSFQAELAMDEEFFEFNFSSNKDAESMFQLPSVQDARSIFEQAKYCAVYRHGESSWNVEVHVPLLKWALRNTPGMVNDGLLDYRYCVNAGILPEFKPTNSPSKMVDFCLVLKVNKQEKQAIDNICLLRPGLSINHTDWGDLAFNPIAVSIETKTNLGSGIGSALLQMSTWHAAQWRSLFYGGEDPRAIGFLPGIIVIGHQWFLIVTVPGDDGRKPTVLAELPIGNTSSILGIYTIIASLQRLKKWAETEFWPAFKESIMHVQQEELG